MFQKKASTLLLYKESFRDPVGFWENAASKELAWFEKWKTVFEGEDGDVKWFNGGKINITYNCLDRHVKNGGGNKVAYIWVNEEGEEVRVSYRELLEKVNRIANMLTKEGS